MSRRFTLAVAQIVVTPGFVQTAVTAWNPLDPVGSLFRDLAEALREWYATLLKAVVDLITTVAVPAPETLVNNFFSLALGATYGFARILVAIIAIIIAFIIIVSPTARHGMKIQRTLTSMLMVIVMGWVFYPLYSLLYNLSKAGTEGLVSIIKTDGENAYDATLRLFTTVNVADAINTIISTGISGVFGVFIIGLAAGLYVATIVVMIFYPLAIAIRPLGTFGARVFNAFNAAILTTLLSPSIMAATYLFPLYIQKYMSPVAMAVSPVFAIIGSVLAVAAPVVIFFLAYKKSSEVFGRLDDASGRFDIGQMPPVSVEDVKNDVQVTQNAGATAIIADALGDSLLYGGDKGDMLDNLVKKGVDIAATATAAAGHPYIGVGLKAAGAGYAHLREGAKEGASGTQPNEGGD